MEKVHGTHDILRRPSEDFFRTVVLGYALKPVFVPRGCPFCSRDTANMGIPL